MTDKPCHEEWYSSWDGCGEHDGSQVNDNGECETVRADKAEAKLQAVRDVLERWEYRPPVSLLDQVRGALGDER